MGPPNPSAKTAEPCSGLRANARRAALLSFALLVAGAVLTLSQAASAQTADELSSKADRTREQARELEGEIQAQGDALAQQEADATTAAGRAAALADRRDAGRARLAELQAQLEQAKGELKAARARLQRSSSALADRLVVIYEHGLPDETDLILSADGFDEVAYRIDYLERIREADAALVDRARSRKAEFDQQVDAAADAREEQKTVTADLESAAAEAAALQADAEQRAAAIAAARTGGREQLGSLEDRASRLDRRASKAAAAAAPEPAPTPASPDGDYAIPTAIVMCESGGDYTALNPISGAGGAYQILPSTWKLYGGKGLPNEAPPAEQDRIAAMIWADSGPSAWECAG